MRAGRRIALPMNDEVIAASFVTSAYLTEFGRNQINDAAFQNMKEVYNRLYRCKYDFKSLKSSQSTHVHSFQIQHT
jgi:hypothetical protein